MFSRLWKIGILALLIRFVIALLGEHGDVVNYYWWSRDLLERSFLGFYERPIANAMPPTYPPVTSYVFWLSAQFHEVIWRISWFLNINIPIFPSNFIFWLESPKGWYFINKLPAIFADLGIIWVLYKFVSELKDKSAGFLAANLFAFIPAFWYNSSLWGQTDSIYALPILCAFYTLYKDKKILAVFFYLLSILTKPTGAFVLPIFIIWWIKKANIKDYFWALVTFFIALILLYKPFHPDNTFIWIINFYKNSLGGELSYIVANAFNFWGLVFGFDNVPETTPFFGIPSNIFGYMIFTFSTLWVVYYIWKKKKLDVKMMLFLAALISFFAFLILPRIHERYFYPTLLLLIPLASIDRGARKATYALSAIHLINLYHFWWVPRVEILIEILSNNLIEKLIIILNIGIFAWLLTKFRRDYARQVK